jgi:hypothetical protein
MKTSFHYDRILRLETSQKLGTVKYTYNADPVLLLRVESFLMAAQSVGLLKGTNVSYCMSRLHYFHLF